MRITFLYAGLLTLLFVALSVRTLVLRRRLRIAVGDADHPTMLRAMRVHANFAEYVPLGLLLMYFVETTGAEARLIHCLGVALLAGRIVHAYGVSQQNERFAFRTAGIGLTLGVLITAAVRLIAVYAFVMAH